MFKKLSVLTTSLVMVGGMAWAEEPAPYNCDFSPSCEVAPGIYGAMGSPVTSKFKMSIGGYIKLDYAHNTNSVGPLAPGAPGGNLAARPAAGYKDESIFTARQSRFWLKMAGPTFLGAKTNALVEMDFYGTGQLANEFGNARMRHAYGSLDWANTQLLFGQFWDAFGPAAADTIDFRQGGTTGAPSSPRVPQVRLTQKINFTPNESLKLVVAVQNPVQVGGTNATSTATTNAGVPWYLESGGDGTMSKYYGTYTSMPNFAGQAVFSSKLLGVSPGMMGLGMSPLQLGLFGITGNMKLAGNTLIQSYGYGAYAFVPVLKSSNGKSRAMTLSLEAQAYRGQALDTQGGTNGLAAANASTPAGAPTVYTVPNANGIGTQTITVPGAAAVANSTLNTGLVGTAGHLSGVKGLGFYGQLKFYVTQDVALTVGHMARRADNAEQFAVTPVGSNVKYEQKNQSTYANVTYDLNAAVRVATEYAHNETTYGNVASGGYAANNVIRFAGYYFF